MSEKKYVIGIDQGTTSSKGVLLGRAGELLGLEKSGTHTIAHPQSGYAEQDIEEIYDEILGIARRLMDGAGARPEEVACLSFSVQTSPLVFWEARTGRPVYPMIGWQDNRGAELLGRFSPEDASRIEKTTGFLLGGAEDPLKVLWLFEHVPGLRDRVLSGEVLWGTNESYIIWRLTGGADGDRGAQLPSYGIEIGSANSACLTDGDRLTWADPDILALFGLAPEMMPPLFASDAMRGLCTVDGLAGIPVCGSMWDGFAALYSHRGLRLGDAKCSYGTGAHVAIDVGPQDELAGKPERSRKIGAYYDDTAHRLIHGNVLYAGATMTWLRDQLGLLSDIGSADRIAASVEDTGGVYLVPAFAGLAAPYHDSDARASITGMTAATAAAHIVRAAAESIAYQIADVMDDLRERAGAAPQRLYADGGASSSAFLMQLQADLLGIDVVCEAIPESSAVGAAYFGGRHTGFYRSLDELTDLSGDSVTYHPGLRTPEELARMTGGWRRAVRSVLENRPDNT